jgi:hypothetical protein
MTRFLMMAAALVAFVASSSDAQAFGKRNKGCSATASVRGGSCASASACATTSFQQGCASGCPAASNLQPAQFAAQPGTTIQGTTVIVDGQPRPVAAQTTSAPDTITINGVTYTRTTPK